jgi:DNA-binding transcriptional LysR family regulator
VASFATQWLISRLARFSAQDLDIDMRLTASTAPVDLPGGAADVHIRYGRSFPGPGCGCSPSCPRRSWRFARQR